MNVELTPDQRAFVQKAIESGRFKREEEAVEEALALWEERERRRLEILAMLDEADASLARGEGIPITEESMRALAEDVKQQGRRRLAASASARPPADGAPPRARGEGRSCRALVLRCRRTEHRNGSPDCSFRLATNQHGEVMETT
jgi:putative addiction module CopG family antidote